MTASLADILTAAKNIVTALNGQTRQEMMAAGMQTASGLTAATLVSSNPGFVVSVSVLVAGSTKGTVYDATAATSTSNPLFAIPDTVGLYPIGMPLANGLVVAPGTGQTVTVNYSTPSVAYAGP